MLESLHILSAWSFQLSQLLLGFVQDFDRPLRNTFPSFPIFDHFFVLETFNQDFFWRTLLDLLLNSSEK